MKKFLAGSVCVAALTLGTAFAQTDASHNFNITATDLATALNQFAQQSDQQIAFTTTATAGKRTKPLRGTYKPQDALDVLLRGTGLKYQLGQDNTIVVSQGDSARATGSDAPQTAAPASAQTAQAAPTTTARVDAANAGIEEVVVTAQKRSERLIDTPVAVTVLSADDLAKLGATQLRDFANTIPGVNFTTNGAGFSQISMRGITGSIADVAATVGIYVDDVPYGPSSAKVQASQLTLDAGLFDVARIEVLRGPQGTLYGASTMGGLLKYVLKKPDTTDFSAEVRGGISGTQHGSVNYDAGAAVNIPLVEDKAAVRASGFQVHDGGYVDNLALGDKNVNKADIYGGRLDVLFQPTDALTIQVGGFLQNIRRDGTATADYTLAGVPIDGTLVHRRLINESLDQDFRLISGNINYDFGEMALTSVSSYQTTDVNYYIDRSGVFVPVVRAQGATTAAAVGILTVPETKKFTQEVRLASTGTDRVEWLIGGFYTDENIARITGFDIRSATGAVIPNTYLTLDTTAPYKELAAFGNLTYRFTERFDISGGVRYADSDQTYTQIGIGPLASSRPRRTTSEDVFTYLANARYRFSDNATGYLRYATGYRPGGLNAVLNDPLTGQPIAAATFDADRLKSYEVGFKAETADRTFGVDMAGYIIDWNNIQILVSRNGIGLTANAPNGAKSRGAEVTLTARPIEELKLLGAFSFQDARLSAADPDLRARKNERLPNVPRFTMSLTADYTVADSAYAPFVGGTVRYVSDRNNSFDNHPSDPQYLFPDYTTLDLRSGFSVDTVDLRFYIHNVFDARAQQSMFSAAANRAGAGLAPVSILQPRTIGVSATTRF